ncbi:MAG: Xaa-Pro peptidase family protein [Chloroflexota bacterium]
MAIPKFGTDREERINYERMREFRLARAREQMAAAGLGALITWEAWNIRYITGNYVTIPTRWLESHAVVLPRNGDPYVYGGASFSPYRLRKEMPWLKDKIFSERVPTKLARTTADLGSWVRVVGRIMSEHGLTGETLGLDGCTCEFLMGEAFAEAGIKTVDAKHIMFEARKIKSQDEIECTRLACANADAGFADIADAIRPGVTESQLVGIGMNRLYALGADEAQEFVCASGPHTNPLRIDYTDRQIRPGDLVVIDINGNSFQGYKSCVYRTFSCGKASAEQKEIYEECRAMLYAGMSAVKAGNTTFDICKNWPDSPQYWGFERWGDVQGYALGHGVGISLHEMPFIFYPTAKANPVTLEEGMVLALETWTGKQGGKDGVRLEEELVVTKDGYDLLTKFPIGELMECWT